MDESKYRPIEVDFDIFQLIVLEKRGFDESDNDALRRLLGLSNPPTQSTPAPRGHTDPGWTKAWNCRRVQN